MAGERTLPGLGLKAYWTLGSNGYKPDMDENFRLLSLAAQGSVLSQVASEPGSPTNGDVHILTSGPEENHLAVRDNGVWVYYTPLPGWIMWSVADGAFYRFNGTVWGLLDAAPRLPVLSGGSDANKALRANGSGTAYVLVSVGDVPVIAGGDALKVLRVKGDETGLEFGEPIPSFNAVTKTADYASVSADFAGNRLIRMNLAGANTFTVGPSMAKGEPLAVTQAGTGQTTIVAGAGVTLVSPGGALKLRTRYSTCSIMKIGTDEYLIAGDVEV